MPIGGPGEPRPENDTALTGGPLDSRMATADADIGDLVKENARAVTAAVSVVGYAVVVAAFAQVIPLPSLSRDAVILLSDLIAVINSLALASLLAGYYYIRRGAVEKHRTAMLTAFALIMLFLVVYVLKVGGGFEKSFVGPETVKLAYFAMLIIHVLLSVVSVPVVLYAVVLGLTHAPEELAETAHAKWGRVAVAAWAVSLALGIVTYLLLNHVYDWVPLHRGGEAALLLLPALRRRR